MLQFTFQFHFKSVSPRNVVSMDCLWEYWHVICCLWDTVTCQRVLFIIVIGYIHVQTTTWISKQTTTGLLGGYRKKTFKIYIVTICTLSSACIIYAINNSKQNVRKRSPGMHCLGNVMYPSVIAFWILKFNGKMDHAKTCLLTYADSEGPVSLRIRAVGSGPSLSANRIIGYYRVYEWRAKARTIFYAWA